MDHGFQICRWIGTNRPIHTQGDREQEEQGTSRRHEGAAGDMRERPDHDMLMSSASLHLPAMSFPRRTWV